MIKGNANPHRSSENSLAVELIEQAGVEAIGVGGIESDHFSRTCVETNDFSREKGGC